MKRLFPALLLALFAAVPVSGDTWWQERTANYRVLSNSGTRQSIRKVLQELERARELYSLYLPKLRPREPGTVKVFRTRREYVAYVGAELEWSIGLWAPARKELIISPPEDPAGRKDREQQLRQVIFHEGFHQFLSCGAEGKNVPVWFHEGGAQFFENSILRGGKRCISLSAGRIFQLQNLFRRPLPDLQAFCTMSHRDFYRDGDRETNYLFAHALFYYLLQAAPSERQKEYSTVLPRYLNALLAGEKPEKAFRTAFRNVDSAKLSENLKRFWSSSKRIKNSLRYRPQRSR